jgi:hypothetical protein
MRPYKFENLRMLQTLLRNVILLLLLSWLRHCAASRKVACSIPNEVIGFFSIYLILSGAGIA